MELIIRFKHTHLLEYSGTPPSPPEKPYDGQQSSHNVDKTVYPKSADMSAVSFSALFSSLNFSVLDKFFLAPTLATSTCCTAAVRILLYACDHRLVKVLLEVMFCEDNVTAKQAGCTES